MVMFILRFFCFNLQEPPKYLMGKGRDEEAVRVIHAVAKKNGKTCDLTLEDLQKCETLFVGNVAPGSPEDEIKKKMARSGESEKLDLHHVKALFCDKKTAWSTSLLIIIWGLIGLGFPLVSLELDSCNDDAVRLMKRLSRSCSTTLSCLTFKPARVSNSVTVRREHSISSGFRIYRAAN